VQAEESPDALMAALTGGKVNASFRLRYETVDDDVPLLKDAEALTLRSIVGYTTGELAGFSAVIEFEDVRVVGGVDDYAPEQLGYSVIADPEETRLNRGFVQYQGIENLTLAAGRQRIAYDNQRFIGNVGWRQNEQTFDSFTSVWNAGDVTVQYAFVNQVNGVMPVLDADVEDHFLNVSWTGLSFVTVTGYGYYLEQDNTHTENDTVGMRMAGSSALNDSLKLIYTAEYAQQETNHFNADYRLGELGIGMGPVTVKAGYETLGSDNGVYGFQTPLGTKHAFNGWADKFLVTPVAGLEDTYLDVTADALGMTWKAVYHEFNSDKGNIDYGNEVDVMVSKAFGKHYVLGVKYATYDADAFSVDTDKFWLWGELKF
jgi:hypothetical protein